MSVHVLVPEDDLKHVLDLLSSSLDWGSGFLCDEDVEAWNRLAKLVGMPQAHKVNRWNPYSSTGSGWVLEGPALESALEEREEARERISYATFDVPIKLRGRSMMRGTPTVSIVGSIGSNDEVVIEWVGDALTKEPLL